MTLSVRDLTIERDGREIIKNFNLSLPPRSITLVKGANGSGKSTLLDSISGLIPATLGTIHLEDNPLHKIEMRKAARLRSYMQQGSEFVLGFQVGEILDLVSKHAAKDSQVRSLKILEQELDIENLHDRTIFDLSGGEKERVSIAIALLREVPLYLFDEPISAQDVTHTEMLANLFKKIAESGAIMVIATHESPGLSRVADREIVLKGS